MNEWKTIKLGEITECLDSKRVPITKNKREEGEVPYYGANGLQGHVKGHIFDEELLLVAEDGGSWGEREKCTYIINGKSWVNNHAHVLRMKLPYLIKYLEHYLNFFDLNKYISGTTRGKLNQKSMNEIEIYLPPENDRKQIVSILERAENLKQKRDETNKETQKIIQSLFYEMFGDPVKNEKGWDEDVLKNLCDLRSGGTPSRKNPEYFNGKIPWITTTALGNEYVDSEDANEYISTDAIKNSATKLIPKNSILIGTRVGVGKLSVNKCDICTNQDIVAIVNLNKKINKNFLKWQLRHYKNFFDTQKQGATIQGIQSNVLKNLKIILPPDGLQDKFEKIVDSLVSIQSKQQSSTEEIKTLFDALMQKAFKGELVE